MAKIRKSRKGLENPAYLATLQTVKQPSRHWEPASPGRAEEGSLARCSGKLLLRVRSASGRMKNLRRISGKALEQTHTPTP